MKSSAELTEELAAHIQSLQIQNGLKNSFLAKTLNALSALASGKTRSASNQLNALANAVHAQRGKS